MSSRLRLVIPAIRELGIRALFHYAVYWLMLRTGYLRLTTAAYRWSDRPLHAWIRSEVPLEQALTRRNPFFFGAQSGSPATLRNGRWDDVIGEANAILAGEYRLFGGPPVAIGHPPVWGHIPLTAASDRLPLGRHWTHYNTEGEHDLRLLWEPARFGSVFSLCRAYRLTGQRRYARGTMALLQSWRAANPPNTGPHWISGQEIALRTLALTFAWHALEDYLEKGEQQAAELLEMIAAHAARLPKTLRYARAQRNNHLLTEAVAMYTVGLLFPPLRQAAEWKAAGRRWLVAAIEDQVFSDGGYIQYSTNYQRLALTVGLWAARLAEVNDEPLPAATIAALRRMTTFLLALTDPQTGRAPNWGHNDGSDILPLSSSSPDDYRPVLQAAALAFLGGSPFEPGEWDETAYWLGLAPNAGKPHDEAGAALDFPHAGLYLLRGKYARASLRSARFAARPAHSDQLHVDLWWRGQYVVRDPGSYRYTAPPPWDNALAAARAHNTLTVDGAEPMLRAGRFLWLNWSNARLLGRWLAEDGSVEAIAAEHRMNNATTHRRTVVRAGASVWVVLDELRGGGAHKARVAWSMIDWPWEFEAQRLTLSGAHGPVRLDVTHSVDTLALYRAGERVAGDAQEGEDPTLLGWWSPTYGYKEPALSLVALLEGPLPLRVTSWWRLGEVGGQELALEWGSLEQDPLMAFVSKA